MKKQLATILLCFLSSIATIAQTGYKVGFKDDSLSYTKSRNDIIKEIKVATFNLKDSLLKNYKLSIVPDHSVSTLPATDYRIDYPAKSLNALSDTEHIYFTLLKDTKNDRERTLVLKVKVSKPDSIPDSNAINMADNQKLTITVHPHNQPLESFRHLAYIGTNFDLVNGVKAKNLFFAANFFVPKHETGRGFYLSIYGNRAFSLTDSSAKVVYPSKTIGMGDSSLVYNSKADVLRTRSTDNIGAYFAILKPLWRKHRHKHSFEFYYSPGCEFIWRRTTVNTQYKNITFVDSAYSSNPLQEGITLETPTVQDYYLNTFDVNYLALNFTLVHETENISIRVRLASGFNSYYTPKQSNNGLFNSEYNSNYDISFLGKAWVTEATTGITIQAEIFNRFFNPQPYYGVTLSKAINFKDLGTVVQPLSKR